MLRIGELSRRTGVGADTLRAWERRYGLIEPVRSPGGFRLYGPDDERRVRSMKSHIDSGLAAAEAARLATAEPAPAPLPGSELRGGELAQRLLDALQRFDEPAANAILDEALAALTIDAVIEVVVLPAMREIGERWAAGDTSVAQEHFATSVLRGRLLSVARNWGAGGGSHALLACPSGEHHDLGLVAFGVVMRGRGWRITYLGPDTPVDTVAMAAEALDPDVVVLASLEQSCFERAAEEVAALSARRPVVLAGAGADAELAERLGARALDPDVVRAGAALDSSIQAPRRAREPTKTSGPPGADPASRSGT